MKYKKFTIIQKLMILADAKEYGTRRAAEIHNISRQLICYWIRHNTELVELIGGAMADKGERIREFINKQKQNNEKRS